MRFLDLYPMLAWRHSELSFGVWRRITPKKLVALLSCEGRLAVARRFLGARP